MATTIKERILKLVLNNSGTSGEIAEKLEVPVTHVSSALTYLFNGKFISRKVDKDKSMGKRLVYRYYRPGTLGTVMSEGGPVRKRKVPEVKQETVVPEQKGPVVLSGEMTQSPVNVALTSPSSGNKDTFDKMSHHMEALADLWADVFIARVFAKVQAALDGKMQELIGEVGKPPTVEKPVLQEFINQAPARPRVLIMGLLAGQAQIIKEEFIKEFDLRFWSVDDGLPRLRSLSITADDILVMTSKISHKMTDIIRPRKYIPVGGLSAIRTILTEKFLVAKESTPLQAPNGPGAAPQAVTAAPGPGV